MHNNS